MNDSTRIGAEGVLAVMLLCAVLGGAGLKWERNLAHAPRDHDSASFYEEIAVDLGR